MSETITSEPTAEESAELYAAIDQALAKMDELHEKMRRDDAVIEESSRATREMLGEMNVNPKILPV